LLSLAAGCDGFWHKVGGHQLSLGHEQGDELGANAPPADGPKLGILADFTPVFDAPDRNGRRLGWLHAGAQVPRAEKATQASGCAEGWFAVFPRGYVCVGSGATLDLKHPTLAAMGLSPRLNEPLPYPYAEARVATEVFVPNNEPEPAVHSVGRLRPAATFAVVGSWQAMDETDQRLRLALMTRGTFVRADDLRAAETPKPSGVRLEAGHQGLPLAFVTTDGARSWRLEGEQATPQRTLTRGSTWHVGVRPKLLGAVRYYPLDDGTWVQDSDVTLARLRNEWPAFATGTKHWADLNLDENTVVLYEGQRPTFAALTLSVPKQSNSKYVGQTEVIAKYVTDMQPDPRNGDSSHEVYDVPWVVELRNGLRIHAGLGRQRRGSVLQAPRVELAPPDAQFVWNWVAPALPAGWHGVAASQSAERRTQVLVR
jgi:hypothetical protein